MASLALAAASRSAGAQQHIPIIDTHFHLERGPRRQDSVEAALILRAMDAFGLEKVILTPPPLPPGPAARYGLNQLRAIAGREKQRLAFMAGGDSLNAIIQGTAPERVSADILRRFTESAEMIAEAGAAGFGELAAEHFSSNVGAHPYESSPLDHPLFLALADIAARHAMPIEIHMEAVPEDMPFPDIRRKGGRNPEKLRGNILGLERLLDHNTQAQIVWLHAGWDLTGERTVPLMRRLLAAHRNLAMSIKIEGGNRLTQPLTPEGEVKPGWLAMLRDFPDRFVIGSDTFIDEGTDATQSVRRFVDALPPALAVPIARENATRIYRLS